MVVNFRVAPVILPTVDIRDGLVLPRGHLALVDDLVLLVVLALDDASTALAIRVAT